MLTSPLVAALVAAFALTLAPARAMAQAEAPAPGAALAVPGGFADLAFVPTRLEIAGTTVYPPRQVLAFALALAAQSGEALTVARMSALIGQVYREDGFALAEVRAEVDEAQALLRWQVLEGHVAEVRVTGADEATRQRIERYFEPVWRERPLRQATLERAVALADDLGGLGIATRLVPLEPAGHRLDVAVTSMLPYSGISVDAVPMRPGHSTRLALQHERYSLINPGDLVRLQALATTDRGSGHSWLGRINYRTPGGGDGDYLELIAGNGRSDRDPGGLAQSTEIRGTHLTLAWGYPYQRDLHSYRYAIGVLDHASARFQPGTGSVRSEATAARFYLVNGHTDGDGRLLQYAVELSTGARSSTPAGQPADGRRHFSHLRAGLGASANAAWAGSLWSYRFEGLGQWTSQALPSVEKFALGHHPFLRGYAPAEVVSDRGLAATLELAHLGSPDAGVDRLSPFAFVSAGHASNVATAGATAGSRTLASTGLGLRGNPIPRIGLEAWCAWPLRAGPLSEARDPAVYVQVGTQW
jgi:hemolysin activation/secretion protein